MNAQEALHIHSTLWDEDRPMRVKVRDKSFQIERVCDSTRDFSRVFIDGRLVITQNMAKPSKNTSWVSNTDGGQLTWIIKDGNYLGRIRSWLQDGTRHYEVQTLNPESTILRVPHNANR